MKLHINVTVFRRQESDKSCTQHGTNHFCNNTSESTGSPANQTNPHHVNQCLLNDYADTCQNAVSSVSIYVAHSHKNL